MKKKINLEFHPDSIRKASCQGRRKNSDLDNSIVDEKEKEQQIKKKEKTGLIWVFKKIKDYMNRMVDREEEK